MAKLDWAKIGKNSVLLAWLVAGILVLVAPATQWQVNRMAFYKAYGYEIEYENEQRQYEEAQNGNDDDGNGYSQYYKSCGWWNLVCRNKQMKYANIYGDDNNNDNGQNVQTIPKWFLWMGGQTEAMQRWEEENTGQRAEDNEGENTVGQAMVVVYLYLLLVAVLTYGAIKLYKAKTSGITTVLIVLSNVLLLNLLLVPSMISADNRMFEDSVYGWYGQLAVLMAYIDFYGLLFCLAFVLVFFISGRFASKKSSTTTDEEVPYYNYSNPTVEMGGRRY